MLALVENTKRCTKCGEMKPATVEYFSRASWEGDGLNHWCKTCYNAYRRAWRRGEQHSARVLLAEGLKQCTRCMQIFPATLEYFRKHKLGRGGLHPWCKPCDLANSRKIDNANRPIISARKKAFRKENAEFMKTRDKGYRVRNPQRFVEARLQHFYGLSIKDVERMTVEQHGLCAICGRLPAGKKGCGKLHIDHDHNTGEVRALLCTACNKGLGLFRDNIDILKRAAEYIESHKLRQELKQCAS